MGVRLTAGFVVIVAAALSGCGDESPASAPAPSAGQERATTSVRHPATTVFVRPDPSVAPIASLPPTEVTEPCPDSDPSGGSGQNVLAETSRLEPMLGQVLAYGGERPAEFGSSGLIWHDSDDASVFVSFTSNLADHRAALEAMVEHPDELIVCQVAVSGGVAQAVEATLAKELEGRFLSIGRAGGSIEVVLAADEEGLADDLLSRYGDAVHVRVGALAFPLEDAEAVCDDPDPSTDVPGLRIEVVAPAEPISAAGVTPLQLHVELTNDGDIPIQFDSGTAVGTILDLSGKVVSASGTILIADVGFGVDLGPGASTELPLMVSTASCDPELGYVLPPGEYQLVAAVQHSDGDTTTLHSPPVPIVVGGE